MKSIPQLLAAGGFPRRFPNAVVGPIILAFCLALLLDLAVVEPYHVPTGSMAPALLGRHHVHICPRCGLENRVGASRSQYAACQNCGCRLSAHEQPVVEGDQMLVNKCLLWFRWPARWEMIVFRLFGRDFVKRVIGLPGDLIAILDGDVYINNRLARKTPAEFNPSRVLVFDNNHAPANGWSQRWHTTGAAKWQIGETLIIDALGSKDYARLSYMHFDVDEKKCRPITDEYSYNGGNLGAAEAVHDFILVCDIAAEGKGTVAMGITDGSDNEPTVEMRCGSIAHHVEMAFVDRRFTLILDGMVHATRDLPAVSEREPVISPIWFAAKSARLRISNVRLYRDVHYTQIGRNAVAGKRVQLGVDQYFVLGDNSANSEDSRFWPNSGKVPADNLIGKPMAVHVPGGSASWQAFGLNLPDWRRLRWLH